MGSNAAAQKSDFKIQCIGPTLRTLWFGFGEAHRQRAERVEMDYLSKEVFLESDHPWYVPLTVRKEGFVVEPQVRLYRGDVLSGAYASLSGVFGFAEYTTETGFIDNDDWSSVGASLHIGHQLRLGNVVLDGYAGCTWAKDDYPGPYYESTALFPPPSGLRFSGGLRLGFCRSFWKRRKAED